MGTDVDWLLDRRQTTFRFAWDAVTTIDTPDLEMTASISRFEKSGLTWYESSARAKRGAVSFVPRQFEEKPWLFLVGVLEGESGLILPDIGREGMTARSDLRLKRSREDYIIVDKPAGYLSRVFAVNVTLDTIADWFGGRLPSELRPLVTERLDRSVDVPGLDSGTFRILAGRIAGYREPMRRLAIEALAMQMISECLNSLCDLNTVSSGLSPREIAATREARARLVAELRCPPTVSELASEADMTERRLDHAFRELFGASIFRTLCNARLDHAYQARQTGKVPVKELAFRLGYAHASSFSHAFRARFGVFPTQV